MAKRAKKSETAADLIRDINGRLDSLEFLFGLSIKAESRFKPGDRVEFSPAGIRRGFAERTKGKVCTGKVLGVEGWCVKVLLDGYTTPRSYAHIFLNATMKRKPKGPRP